MFFFTSYDSSSKNKLECPNRHKRANCFQDGRAFSKNVSSLIQKKKMQYKWEGGGGN